MFLFFLFSHAPVFALFLPYFDVNKDRHKRDLSSGGCPRRLPGSDFPWFRVEQRLVLHEHATKHAMEHGTPKLTGRGLKGSQGVACLCFIILDCSRWRCYTFRLVRMAFRSCCAVSFLIVISFFSLIIGSSSFISQVLSGLKAAFLKKMKRRAICNLCYDMRGYKVG